MFGLLDERINLSLKKRVTWGRPSWKNLNKKEKGKKKKDGRARDVSPKVKKKNLSSSLSLKLGALLFSRFIF